MAFILILWFYFYVSVSVDYAIHFSGKQKIKINEAQQVYFFICIVFAIVAFFWYPQLVENEGWTNEETFANNINDKNGLIWSMAAASNQTKLSTSCSFSHLVNARVTSATVVVTVVGMM